MILMDCLMPDLDGYDTTKQIRNRESEPGTHRNIIIGLTAIASEADHQKCLNAGMDEYITKPISLDMLRDKLIRIFRMRYRTSSSLDSIEAQIQ